MCGYIPICDLKAVCSSPRTVGHRSTDVFFPLPEPTKHTCTVRRIVVFSDREIRTDRFRVVPETAAVTKGPAPCFVVAAKTHTGLGHGKATSRGDPKRRELKVYIRSFHGVSDCFLNSFRGNLKKKKNSR